MLTITATAPIRVADLGGWTDTWFAGHGVVCNVAVAPLVEVVVAARRDVPDPRVTLDLRSYDERYSYIATAAPGRHPLIEQTLAEINPPGDLALDVRISSGVPPGASTGTSGAVTVALIAALDALTGGRLGPLDLARTAHRVETERLGLQSGVQDPLSAAHGGVSLIEMSEYPTATVTSLDVSDDVATALDERLVLVFLGSTHVSSDVHVQVIRRLEQGSGIEALEPLRAAARDGYAALARGDLDAYAAALRANTDAQRALHPELVSTVAQAVIDAAVGHGAIGWKVNGAGGEGGTVTLLGPETPDGRAALVRAVTAVGAGVRIIPTSLSRAGVEVTQRRSG